MARSRNFQHIGNLLLHLEGNARQWILSGVGGEPDARARQREFDERAQLPRAGLVEKLRATLGEVDGVLARLTARELRGRREIQGYDVSVLEAVFHVVEHFSMHTGQIILLTKTLTASDLAFYDSRAATRRTGAARPAATTDAPKNFRFHIATFRD